MLTIKILEAIGLVIGYLVIDVIQYKVEKKDNDEE